MEKRLEQSGEAARDEGYHGGEGGDAGHEGGGGSPTAAGEDAVEGGHSECPEQGNLEPEGAAECDVQNSLLKV